MLRGSVACSCLPLLLSCSDAPRTQVAVAPAGGSTIAASPSPAPAGSPACGRPGASVGVRREQVAIGGKKRTYTLVVPPGYAPATPYPLVYVLHGNGGSGAQVRAAFDLEAAAQGRALFLYPDGSGGGWDLDAPAAKNRDVALFDATLARTQSSYCVDLGRVFVAGFSNGAYMANQLGCHRGDRIRAVATHSGGGPYANDGSYDEQGHLVCNGKPVASLVVHGGSDRTVPPTEGQKSVDHWTHANRCAGSSPSAPAGCLAFQGCQSPVVACTVRGLGHSVWPPARQLVWSFFDTQGRVPGPGR